MHRITVFASLQSPVVARTSGTSGLLATGPHVLGSPPPVSPRRSLRRRRLSVWSHSDFPLRLSLDRRIKRAEGLPSKQPPTHWLRTRCQRTNQTERRVLPPGGVQAPSVIAVIPGSFFSLPLPFFFFLLLSLALILLLKVTDANLPRCSEHKYRALFSGR